MRNLITDVPGVLVGGGVDAVPGLAQLQHWTQIVGLAQQANGMGNRLLRPCRSPRRSSSASGIWRPARSTG